VVSTLAVAGVIAFVGNITTAKAAGGAYLLEEGTEEFLEGYAGFWALDKLCRPVRIQAELIRLNPVTMLWTASDTGFAINSWHDLKPMRLFHTITPEEQKQQLDLSTDYATRGIVSQLQHAIDQ